MSAASVAWMSETTPEEARRIAEDARDRVHFEDSGEGNVTLSGSSGGHDLQVKSSASEDHRGADFLFETF